MSWDDRACTLELKETSKQIYDMYRYDNYPDQRKGEFVKVSATPHASHRFLFWKPAMKTEKHPFFCRNTLKENKPPPTTQAPKGTST